MKEQLIISGTPERNHAAAALLDREGVAYDRMQEPSRSYSYRNPATFGKPRAYATQEMAAELSACAGDLDYARKQGLIGDLGEKRYYQQYSQYRQMFSSGQALSHLDRIITRDDSVRQFAQPTATDVHIDAILTEI